MAFEKWTPTHRRGKSTELSRLKVGEMWFSDQPYKKLYSRIYGLQKRQGTEFEYMKISNGIIVKRVK